jgi:F-type H+-transporting ATPase subunit alpha
MKFKADEIASVIQKEIEDFRGQIQTAEVGRVIEVGDGIARCTGLSKRCRAKCWNSQRHSRPCVQPGREQRRRGDSRGLPEDQGRRRNSLHGQAVVCACRRSAVGPRGRPAGKSARRQGPVLTTGNSRPVEWQAAGVAERQPVKEPLQTGIKAIDAMTPSWSWSARIDHW